VKKNTVPVFEKPVIIRPKSASDLRLLWRNESKRLGIGQYVEQRQLRIEQDLDTFAVRNDIQDDKEFELWMDNIHNDLENASLEKYMSSHLDIGLLIIERTEPYSRQDYIHVT